MRGAPRSVAAVRLVIAGPALATFVLQLVRAMQLAQLLPPRALVALWSAALAAWALWADGVAIARFLVRLTVCLAAALCFWLSLLETLLARGPVLPRGVLGLAAGAAIHTTLLLVATEPRTASRAGRLGAQLALATSATALTLLGIESAFHAVAPASVYEVVPDDRGAGPLFVPHPTCLWQLRPGFRGRYIHPEFRGTRVAINDLGFRDGLDETAPPPAGEASILVLGDSLAFGTGVELDETFHRILEKRGAAIARRPLHVYGAGVPGFGQVDELHFLESVAPRIRPDVVIVALYEGNDLEENLVRARTVSEAPHAPPPGPPPPPRSALVPFLRGIGRPRFWIGSSAAVQYLLPAIDRPLAWLGIVSPLLPTNAFLDARLLLSSPPEVRDALATTREVLAAIAQQTAQRGADLIVLIIPAAIQADAERFRDFLALHREPRRTAYSRTQLHREVVELVRGLAIRDVDPLPALEAAARAGRRCYYREGHWNAAGHALAAELLEPVLVEVFATRAETPLGSTARASPGPPGRPR